VSSRPLIVFDVNETLLDLEHVTPVFERIFGKPEAMRLWFANLILYSCALTVAQTYVPFTDIASAALDMLARTSDVKIAPKDKEDLITAFSEMPAHPEVPSALDRLRAHGFRLFTLTDNMLEVQTRQLEHAGIVDRFEQRFSVDQGVRRHKPAPEAYAHVSQTLSTAPSQMLLIACHTWDTLGAVAAGWQAALIKRPGNETLAVGGQPQFIGQDLNDVADQLIARYN
jgi:2-haloacid dehalogenase